MAGRVLWIGGSQWAGKTTVAGILGGRCGLPVYDYDYHDSRGHSDRVLAQPERYPAFAHFLALTNDERWCDSPPEEMAAVAQAIFDERFEMTLEDLAAIDAPLVIAEGWGLRPRHIASVTDDRRDSIFLVPTEEWRQHQVRTFPKAATFIMEVRDPALGQANRLARNLILSRDLEAEADAFGLRVLHIDGRRDADAVADIVADHFRLTGTA